MSGDALRVRPEPMRRSELANIEDEWMNANAGKGAGAEGTPRLRGYSAMLGGIVVFDR